MKRLPMKIKPALPYVYLKYLIDLSVGDTVICIYRDDDGKFIRMQKATVLARYPHFIWIQWPGKQCIDTLTLSQMYCWEPEVRRIGGKDHR